MSTNLTNYAQHKDVKRRGKSNVVESLNLDRLGPPKAVHFIQLRKQIKVKNFLF